MHKELQDFRESIDFIDKAIIYLLAERMRVVKKVGKYKKKNNIPPLQPKRWQQVLSSKLDKADKIGLDIKMVKDIYNRIHQSALELEKKV